MTEDRGQKTKDGKHKKEGKNIIRIIGSHILYKRRNRIFFLSSAIRHLSSVICFLSTVFFDLSSVLLVSVNIEKRDTTSR
jgi:hypothetical protein